MVAFAAVNFAASPLTVLICAVQPFSTWDLSIWFNVQWRLMVSSPQSSLRMRAVEDVSGAAACKHKNLHHFEELCKTSPSKTGPTLSLLLATSNTNQPRVDMRWKKRMTCAYYEYEKLASKAVLRHFCSSNMAASTVWESLRFCGVNGAATGRETHKLRGATVEKIRLRRMETLHWPASC